MGTSGRGPKKILDNLYLVGSFSRSAETDCCVYAVTTPEGTILIDCGSPGGLKNVEENLKEIGTSLADTLLIIGTHCHYDHVGAAAAIKREYPAVMFAAHEDDCAAIEDADQSTTCASWIFFEEFEGVKVDEQLSDGAILNIAGMEFEIVSAPGHSPGSIIVTADIDGKRVAFLGDCYAPGSPRAGYNQRDLFETWALLTNVGADIVCPGHEGHEITHPVVHGALSGPAAEIVRMLAAIPAIAEPFCAFHSIIYANTGHVNSIWKGLKEIFGVVRQP